MSIKFDHVVRLNTNEYMFYLNSKNIVDLWNEGRIYYNPDIQRGVKITKDENGNNIKVPVCNKKNIEKIKESIENKKFYVSQITLNVDPKETDVNYNQENGTLEIEGNIEILDGQHRIRALEKINEKNVNNEYEENIDLEKIIFPIKLSTYEEEKAQEQFYQFTLGSRISSSRKEFFNNKDYSNKIAKALYNNSVLKGKIDNIKNSISKKEEEKVFTYNTLKTAIDLNYNTIVSEKEAKKVEEYLREFFEELFNVIPEFNDFSARKEIRANSLRCENFSLYGYVAIAKWLQDSEFKNDWKKCLQYINEMNLDKSNKSWKQFIISKKKKDKHSKSDIHIYNIINNSQSRQAIIVAYTKEFKNIVALKEGSEE